MVRWMRKERKEMISHYLCKEQSLYKLKKKEKEVMLIG